VLTALDLIGIFAFAVSGALVAIGRDLDVVGIAMLALATALGGGILRDLVLGATPPTALERWEYLCVPFVAAALALVAHPALEQQARALVVFDAAGLGLFCVAGTVKAVEHGLALVPAAVVGTATAVGGGVLRDVLIQETPAIARPDSELYAVPALVGGLAVATAWDLGADAPVIGAAAAVAIFVVRLVALDRHWRGPRATRRPARPAPLLRGDRPAPKQAP
jgi:uncharacterized membrane protein YeiH